MSGKYANETSPIPPSGGHMKIRIGEHDIDVADLAEALTSAGGLLASILDGKPEAPTVETTTYVGARTLEHACLVYALRPGEGVFRDRDGQLHAFEVQTFTNAAHDFSRITGIVTAKI